MRARPPAGASGDAAFAFAMLAVLYGWTLRGNFWKDFRFEAEPAVRRLLAGDLHGFLAGSPVYGGSLVLRAPFMALAANVTEAYRLGAVVCAVPLVGLALRLMRGSAAGRAGRPLRWLVIALVVINPAAASAMQFGHPEDVLAAGLMVGAALLALDGRSLLAGLLLGVAVASKQWAIIAIPLILVSAPRRRPRMLGAAAVGGGLLVLPLWLAGPANFAAANLGAATAATFMNPANLWWLLGGWYQRRLGGPRSSVLVPAPSDLAAQLSHPLIVAIPVVFALVWAWRRQRLASVDALLLLAAASLLRCVLDPWNIVYYHLPFLLALLAWEVRTRKGPPVLAVVATAAVCLTFQTIPSLMGTGAETAVYLAWTTPALIAMIVRAFRLVSLPASGGVEGTAALALAGYGRLRVPHATTTARGSSAWR